MDSRGTPVKQGSDLSHNSRYNLHLPAWHLPTHTDTHMLLWQTHAQQSLPMQQDIHQDHRVDIKDQITPPSMRHIDNPDVSRNPIKT